MQNLKRIAIYYYNDLCKKTLIYNDQPTIEPQNIEWDQNCVSIKEYSAYNSMVDKLCQLQTSTEYPKHAKNRLLAPVSCNLV